VSYLGGASLNSLLELAGAEGANWKSRFIAITFQIAAIFRSRTQ
jgi:hypothetical protein